MTAATRSAAPLGIDDIPIILQDRTFDSRGRFLLRGRAVTGLLGDRILVNGTYNPHLMITARRVRLRILNASTARIYHLAFADDREFLIIGTDCGLLPAPRRTRRLLLSPAERAEIVLDLRPGEQPVLRSVPWDLNMIKPLTNGAGGNDYLDLLQLRTRSSLATGVALPERLGTKPAAALDNVAVRRNIQLDGREISGRPIEDMGRIDTVVGAGTTELWTVRNRTTSRTTSMSTAWRFRSSPLVLPPPSLGSAGKTPCCLPLARRYSWPSSSRGIRIR